MFLIKILIGVLVAIEVYERWIEPKRHPEPEPEPAYEKPEPPSPEEVAREVQRQIVNFCKRCGLRWTFLEEPDPQAPAWPGFAVRITDGHEATADKIEPYKIHDVILQETSPELITRQVTKHWRQKYDRGWTAARAAAEGILTPNEAREYTGIKSPFIVTHYNAGHGSGDASDALEYCRALEENEE